MVDPVYRYHKPGQLEKRKKRKRKKSCSKWMEGLTFMPLAKKGVNPSKRSPELGDKY